MARIEERQHANLQINLNSCSVPLQLCTSIHLFFFLRFSHLDANYAQASDWIQLRSIRAVVCVILSYRMCVHMSKSNYSFSPKISGDDTSHDAPVGYKSYSSVCYAYPVSRRRRREQLSDTILSAINCMRHQMSTECAWKIGRLPIATNSK